MLAFKLMAGAANKKSLSIFKVGCFNIQNSSTLRETHFFLACYLHAKFGKNASLHDLDNNLDTSNHSLSTGKLGAQFSGAHCAQNTISCTKNVSYSSVKFDAQILFLLFLCATIEISVLNRKRPKGQILNFEVLIDLTKNTKIIFM